jgi:integrase
MAGSVYKRGATWTAHVTWQEGGKWRQQKKGGHRTKKLAEQTLTQLQASVDSGTYVAPSRLTVGGYLDQWLDSLDATGLRASTITGYRGALRRYVDDELRAVKLTELTALHLDVLYVTVGRRVSKRTVRHVHVILHKALGDARRKGLVRHNVADDASPPRGASVRTRDMAVWTPGELATFLAATSDHRHGALFRLGALTGMRRSELCGLRWADVDLDEGLVRVRQTVSAMAPGPPTVEDVKQPRSRRTIDVDSATVKQLRAHRACQTAQRLLIGTGYRDHDLVFAAPDGMPLHPDVVSKAFARAVEEVNVPRIRLHDLRHSHATHSLSSPGPNRARITSERLGHASVGFTLDTYGHVLPGQGAEVAAAIAKLVDG